MTAWRGPTGRWGSGLVVVALMTACSGVSVAQVSGVPPEFSARKFPGKKPPTVASVSPEVSAPNGQVLVQTAPTSVGLIDGVSLRFPLPQGWAPESAPAVDLTDLQQIKDARQVVRSAWGEPPGGADAHFRVVCVAAPVDRWVTGGHDVVFDRVNSIVRQRVERDVTIERFTKRPWKQHGLVAEQDYSFQGREGGTKSSGGVQVLENEKDGAGQRRIKGAGKNLILFSPSSVVVCSVQCEGRGDNPACFGSVRRLEARGPLAEEPTGDEGGRLAQIGRILSTSLGTGPVVLFILAGLMAVAGLAALLRGLWLRSKQARALAGREAN